MSIVRELNEQIERIVPGTSRLYGLVQEKSIQDGVVLVAGDTIVDACSDQYDNVFFHKETEDRKHEKRKFGYRETATIALCCYCKETVTYDLVKSLFGSQDDVMLISENTTPLDVLKKYFLIDDPLKNEGFNQEQYIFAFLYETTRFRSYSEPGYCCETTC